MADRHFQQTLDVHARVGEFPAELGRFSGLVCGLDLQGRTLGELQARALQGGAYGGLVAGGEQDGPALSGHHTGELKLDAALGAHIAKMCELAWLVLQLDTEEVHHNSLPPGTPAPRNLRPLQCAGAGAPDGADHGDDLVVDLLSDEQRSCDAGSLASSGDGPRADASVPAGGLDECQLLRPGGTPPNGLDRVGHESMVAVGGEESMGQAPDATSTPLQQWSLFLRRARQHPVN